MLKSIGFNGFKSFADRVEVDFTKGITAIIGPNGSGKSNISDGLKWVLGSQSAKDLRGGKMEDVIFSGSDSRKASKSAEVTLLIDNSDNLLKKINADEVSVTRKITKNKGSEYYIDGEPARLKDVQDIFLDSGIGSSSYSLIGQGQILKILSTKVEERRAIFEEASGIVKLKQKKEQAEKRLKDVDSNIMRLDDIIIELKKQLSPLKTQAKKAKEHIHLQENLTKIETQYLLNQLDKNTHIIKSHETSIASIENELKLFNDELTTYNNKYSDLKSKYQNENEELFNEQTVYSEIKEEYEKLNGIVSLNNERITNAKKRVNDIQKQLTEIDNKHTFSSAEYIEKKEKASTLKQTIEDNEKALADTYEKIEDLKNERTLLKSEIDQTRNKSASNFNHLSQQQIQLEALIKGETDLTNKKEHLSQKVNNLMSEKVANDTSLEQFEAELSTLKDKLVTCRSSKEVLEKKNASIRHIFQKNEEALKKVESLYLSKKSQYDSLSSLLDNNDMYFDGVKSILNEVKKGRIDGVFGTIAENISVDKSYEKAIDALLQSTMQFIVVENDAVAQTCVDFLKRTRSGKATFIPLNMAKSQTLSSFEKSKAVNSNGISMATELVDFSEHIKDVIFSLLGRSLIAKDLKTARTFARETGIKCKISSLEGELIQGSTISGGISRNKKRSILTKKRELTELSESVNSLFSQLEELKKQHKQHANDKDEIENNLSTINQDVELLQNNLVNVQQYYNEHKRIQETLADKLDMVEIEQKETKIDLKEIKNKRVKIEFNLEEEEKNHHTGLSDINTLNEQLAGNDDALETMEKNKNDLIIGVNSSLEELKMIETYLTDFDDENHNIKDKLINLQTELSEEKQSLVDYYAHKENAETELINIKKNLDTSSVSIEKLRDNTKGSIGVIDDLGAKIESVRNKINEKEKELTKEKLKLNKKETENDSFYTQLYETYRLDAKAITETKRIKIDLIEAKEKIKRLKQSLSKLGNINHNAVDEYSQLHERYTEENKQLDDIKNAKKDLLSLIENVKNEMVQRFMETFKAIASNFKKTFNDLFEGGNAKLSLLEPNNPLTSPIEIKAQPPGKKPQSIDLLSGGEKAFTAVAIIFSIISVKPSPFIILDEVDAPLDDANVARFAYYLREFSKKSQFIVVTHRQGTMKIADSIYGVSQEDPGVTIMFPHKLEFDRDEEKEEKSS